MLHFLIIHNIMTLVEIKAANDIIGRVFKFEVISKVEVSASRVTEWARGVGDMPNLSIRIFSSYIYAEKRYYLIGKVSIFSRELTQ
jgi:hypothetical protein